jgi:ribosome-associated heat shock protein Hsp15
MATARQTGQNGQQRADACQRLDRWLYFTRLAKSRTIAADLVLAGKVRVDRIRASKPSQLLRIGQVVTIALRGRVMVLRVLAPGDRRGPAVEARTLYEIVSAPQSGPKWADDGSAPSGGKIEDPEAAA